MSVSLKTTTTGINGMKRNGLPAPEKALRPVQCCQAC